MTNKEYRKEYYKRNKQIYLETGIKRYRKNNPEIKHQKGIRHTEQYALSTKRLHSSIPAGVYMIKNLITGERYIGQSVKPYRRRGEHFSILTNNKNQCSPNVLQDAMEQYGKTCFVFGVLEHCGKEELLAKEQYYINLYKPEYNAN